MTITNNGTLSGAGGAANGGAGGDAFEADVACIFINNGTIRAGGGGGGQGGWRRWRHWRSRKLHTYYTSAVGVLILCLHSYVQHSANTTTYWRYQGINVYPTTTDTAVIGGNTHSGSTSIKEKAIVVIGMPVVLPDILARWFSVLLVYNYYYRHPTTHSS